MKPSRYVTTGISAMLTIAAVVPVAAWAAANSDPEFRECGRAAMAVRESRMVAALGAYEGEWMAAQNERAARVLEAWNHEDDRARREDQDNAVRDYNRRRNDARKSYDTEVRNAERDYRNDYNRCYQDFKNRERERRNQERNGGF